MDSFEAEIAMERIIQLSGCESATEFCSCGWCGAVAAARSIMTEGAIDGDIEFVESAIKTLTEGAA